MKTFFLLILSSSVVAWSGCNSGSEDDSIGTDTDTTAHVEQTTWTSGNITLSLKENSPEFPDAALTINSPSGPVPAGPVQFAYDVANYQLTDQTEGGDHCANSKDGQHIHLILNNAPYLARYTTEFEEDLEAGHYVCMSFLSRSYHESIKNGHAHKVSQFTVGDAETEDVDLSSPHMFYSRPKGEYSGDGATHILLDFFLVNCDLSEDGYKVKLKVNDSEKFTFTQWSPYVIEGMPMGENWIELELIDAEGSTVNSPFNPVKRSIVLKETS